MENPPPIDPMYPAPTLQAPNHIAYASVVASKSRPGILTAIGIISIVLGALGILANCSGIFQAIMYKSFSTASGAGFARPVTTTTTTTTTSGGTVTTVSSGSNGVSIATATTAPSTPGTVPIPTMFNMRSTTTNVMLIEAILSMAIAIALLALGILTLLNKRSARRGHLIYAWVKLAAVVVSVTATWMMYSDIFSSMPMGPGSNAMGGSMALVASIFAGAFACVYPIALMIALRARSVTNFYQNLATGDVA